MYWGEAAPVALGGDGLVAQAVPLTGREHEGQGKDWKGERHHLGSWCWELEGSCILLASPHVDPLGTKERTGRSRRRMPQQSLLYPPTPQLGLQGQQGAQRLGAGRSLVPGGPMAGSITECQGTAELLCTRPWKI